MLTYAIDFDLKYQVLYSFQKYDVLRNCPILGLN